MDMYREHGFQKRKMAVLEIYLFQAFKRPNLRTVQKPDET